MRPFLRLPLKSARCTTRAHGSMTCFTRGTGIKDYVAEAAQLHQIITEACPPARTLLDVACGTGAHLTTHGGVRPGSGGRRLRRLKSEVSALASRTSALRRGRPSRVRDLHVQSAHHAPNEVPPSARRRTRSYFAALHLDAGAPATSLSRSTPGLSAIRSASSCRSNRHQRTRYAVVALDGAEMRKAVTAFSKPFSSSCSGRASTTPCSRRWVSSLSKTSPARA